jgi:DNA-damage-inducible protein J
LRGSGHFQVMSIFMERAADALEAMGLSISDAIRLLMLRIADERRLPFEVKVPNATTRKAIAELEAGKGKSFNNVEAGKAWLAHLHANDLSFPSFVILVMDDDPFAEKAHCWQVITSLTFPVVG